MANIAVFNSHTLWPLHYETELEIIQDLENADNEIYQVVCNGDISICDLNISNEPLRCLQCIEKRKKGMRLIKPRSTRKKNLHILDYEQLTGQDKQDILNMKFNYTTIEELKMLKVENFDIGLAVISSVVSSIRDSTLDVKFYKELIDKYLNNSLMIFFSAKRIIEKYKISKFYIFNGRFAYPRAVLRACQQKSIDCYIHESGGTIYKYEVFQNELPHDIKFTQNLIEKFWEQGSGKDRAALGRLFFEERSKAIPQNYYSFVGDQEPAKLPDSWDAKNHNIVIFNSSEDEMVSIGGEWENKLYKGQGDGIDKIIRELSVFPNIKVYLRMHPNLYDVDDGYVQFLNSLKADNFERIDPKSTISTYQLINSADKIVTFGSTLGVEAAYWGKVSVLLGSSYYKEKSCVYEPKSHDEAIRLLIDLKLKPIASDFPLKYGYYFKNRGIDFKHYKPSNLYQGNYNGFNLNTFKSKKYIILKKKIFNNRIIRSILGPLYKKLILSLSKI